MNGQNVVRIPSPIGKNYLEVGKKDLSYTIVIHYRDIKSIVTKEQFKEMEYKIDEKI